MMPSWAVGLPSLSAYGSSVGVTSGGPAVCVIYTDCCVARTRSVASSVGRVTGAVVGTIAGGTGVAGLLKLCTPPGSGSGVHVNVGVGV